MTEQEQKALLGRLVFHPYHGIGIVGGWSNLKEDGWYYVDYHGTANTPAGSRLCYALADILPILLPESNTANIKLT